MKSSKYTTATWKSHELNPKDTTSDPCSVIDWIFLVDLLNFSFWSSSQLFENKPPYTVSYNGKSYTGYWTLPACINRALENGIPITSPSFYKDIDEKTFRNVFKSDTEEEIPLIQERVESMRQAGSVLCEVGGLALFNRCNSINSKANKYLNNSSTLTDPSPIALNNPTKALSNY